MKKINLWDSSQSQNFIFFNNTKDYFNYLTENNLSLEFITKESYTPIDDVESAEDKYALENNISLTYTDETHPIAYSKEKTYINPVFFKKNIERFKKYAIEEFERQLLQKKNNIIIPDFIFTDSLIYILTFLKRDKNFIVKEFDKGIKLTDKQRKTLQDNFIELSIEKRFNPKEIISSKYVINYYTLDDLKSNPEIILELPTTKEILERLIHVNATSKIILKQSGINKNDDNLYYDNVLYIFNILSKINHPFNIEITVTHRELFKIHNIINKKPSNINLSINNNRYTYSIEEYQKEEAKLDKLVKPIKESNLSPFEKFIAVYNIVKKYKPYKDTDKLDCLYQDGRVLKYVLDDDNDYMVCEGYAKLLKVLLDKVNIDAQEVIAHVDITKDEDYDETKDNDRCGHDRILVFIDDDKYNIHGYYLSDPTFDNITNYDLYLNCLMTFDRKKESQRNEFLEKEDLLLDFHNFEEFQRKINFYLKRKINENRYKTETENIQYAYTTLYITILKLLKDIDYSEYSYLFDKYNKDLTNSNLELSKLEKIASDFLTEYANYIIPLSNNHINFETILLAASVVKSKINNYDNEELSNWLIDTIKNNEKVGNTTLPYIYDSSNPTEAYLIDKPHKKSKTK